MSRKRLVQNICEYPYQMNESRYRRWAPETSFMQQRKANQTGYQTGFNQTQKRVYSEPNYPSDSRTVVFKGQRDLGTGTTFVVESSIDRGNLFITAYSTVSPESYLIEIPAKKVNDMLKEFSNDHEEMCSNLKLMNKRMVLLNPRFQQRNAKSQSPERLGSQDSPE